MKLTLKAKQNLDFTISTYDLCNALEAQDLYNTELQSIAAVCIRKTPEYHLESEGNGMYWEDHPRRELVKYLASFLSIDDLKWLKNEIKLQTNKSN
jgi:hypothetical protein